MPLIANMSSSNGELVCSIAKVELEVPEDAKTTFQEACLRCEQMVFIKDEDPIVTDKAVGHLKVSELPLRMAGADRTMAKHF